MIIDLVTIMNTNNGVIDLMKAEIINTQLKAEAKNKAKKKPSPRTQLSSYLTASAYSAVASSFAGRSNNSM